MKSHVLRLLALVAIALSVTTVHAHNDKKKVAGPNGGSPQTPGTRQLTY